MGHICYSTGKNVHDFIPLFTTHVSILNIWCTMVPQGRPCRIVIKDIVTAECKLLLQSVSQCKLFADKSTTK